MFNKKEIAWIIVMLIVFEFIIIFPSANSLNPLTLLVPVFILIANLVSKKIAAGFFNIKIEYKPWELQRYGYPKKAIFKNPVQLGLILPFALSLLSIGAVKMFTFFQFEEENIRETRILKQRGLKRKEEINDSDSAFTAAWGFLSLLILALIGAFPLVKDLFPNLSEYAVLFGVWNMIPFSKLDGMKLFMGSILTWAFLAILYVIALVLVFA